MINKHVFMAAFEYYQRKKYENKPEGTYDRQGRWYPSEHEHYACCDKIRSPSYNWPYPLLHHCNTSTHIITKYKVDRQQFNACLKECKEVFEKEWELGLDSILKKLPENFEESDIIEAFVEQKL
jgi:hypothetical protein